jgi:hypothetical protein
MFTIDDIIDFVLRNLFLILGLLVFAARIYGQYVEASKKAAQEREFQLEQQRRREYGESYEGYLERTNAKKLDDNDDDFTQSDNDGPPTHAGSRPPPKSFDELARDLQEARSQTSTPRDPQAELRRLLEEKMGRAPKTSTSGQANSGQSSSGQASSGQANSGHAASPTIGRPSSSAQLKTRRPPPSSAFEPDRTAASTFKPSSVTSPNSLEQNRAIEASFEMRISKGSISSNDVSTPTKPRRMTGSVFNAQDAVRAVIWNEILGAPKSKRR